MMDFDYFVRKNKISNDNLDNYLGYIALYLNTKHALNVFRWFLSQHIDIDKVFNYLDNNDKPIRYNYVVYRLVSNGYEEIINKHLDYFTKNNNGLLELKDLLKSTDLNLSILNNYINDHHMIVLEEMLLSSAHISIKDMKEANLWDFYQELVKELLTHENVNYSDIKILGKGSFTTAYLIGSKVFKVGHKRKTFKIKNNKRFLKPLLRKEFIINDELSLCIEIVEELDMESVSKMDADMLEEELLKAGIGWYDKQVSNIGRLKKDNKIYYDDIDYVDKEATGYLDDNDEVLPKGSIAFADNDYIYEKDNAEYNPFIMKGKR